MEKFNGWERMNILQGLNLVKHHYKADIEEIEAQGKVALFSAEYIDMMIAEIKLKVESLSKQEKKCKPKV